MPMNWNAEADAKLFLAIIQVYGVKLTQEHATAVAAIMGPECTPRAIKEHIVTLKKRAGGSAPATAPKSTPTKAARSTNGTPRKRKGGNIAGAMTDGFSDDEEDIGNFKTPTKKERPSRDLKSATPIYAEVSDEEDYESPSKRIKREPSNDFEGEMYGDADSFLRDQFDRGQSGDLH